MPGSRSSSTCVWVWQTFVAIAIAITLGFCRCVDAGLVIKNELTGQTMSSTACVVESHENSFTTDVGLLQDAKFVDFKGLEENGLKDAFCAAKPFDDPLNLAQGNIIIVPALEYYCSVGAFASTAKTHKEGWSSLTDIAANAKIPFVASMPLRVRADVTIPGFSVNFLGWDRRVDNLVCNHFGLTSAQHEMPKEMVFTFPTDDPLDKNVGIENLSVTIVVDNNPWIAMWDNPVYIIWFQAVAPTLFLGTAALAIYMLFQWSRIWRAEKQRNNKWTVIWVLGTNVFTGITLAGFFYASGWGRAPTEFYSWWFFIPMWSGLLCASSLSTGLFWYQLRSSIQKPTVATSSASQRRALLIANIAIYCVFGVVDLCTLVMIIYDITNIFYVFIILTIVGQLVTIIYYVVQIIWTFAILRKKFVSKLSQNRAAKVEMWHRLKHTAYFLLAYSGAEIIVIFGVCNLALNGFLFTPDSWWPVMCFFYTAARIICSYMQIMALRFPSAKSKRSDIHKGSKQPRSNPKATGNSIKLTDAVVNARSTSTALVTGGDVSTGTRKSSINLASASGSQADVQNDVP